MKKHYDVNLVVKMNDEMQPVELENIAAADAAAAGKAALSFFGWSESVVIRKIMQRHEEAMS